MDPARKPAPISRAKSLSDVAAWSASHSVFRRNLRDWGDHVRTLTVRAHALGRVVLPPRLLRATAWLMQGLQRIVDVPPVLTPEALRVMAGVTYFGSSQKAERELEFSARPLVEGMEQTLEYEIRELQRGKAPT